MSKIIMSADIHISSNTPVARTDNYLEALGKKLLWLEELRNKHNAIILDAGDLLDKFEIGSEMLNWCFKYIPKSMWTVRGNHESRNHNHNLYHKTSLSVLENAGTIELLDRRMINDFYVCGKDYGTDDVSGSLLKGGLNILVTHEMVCEEKQSHDHFQYSTAKALLKKYPQFQVILSGHNHRSFKVDYEGRSLINVGSLMRRDITQKDYQPRVMLYDTEDNSFEWIDVPITDNVISTKHKDIIKLRDERIDSFVDKLKDSENIGISFEDNLEKHFEINNTDEVYKKKIYNSMELKGDR